MGKYKADLPLDKALQELDLEGELREISIGGREGLGEFLATESKKRAPRDKGTLEDNIGWELVSPRSVEIYSGARSDEGELYAAEIHERTDYNLGPRSLEKQAGQTEMVGPKYLSRAADDNMDKFGSVFLEGAEKRTRNRNA